MNEIDLKLKLPIGIGSDIFLSALLQISLAMPALPIKPEPKPTDLHGSRLLTA